MHVQKLNNRNYSKMVDEIYSQIKEGVVAIIIYRGQILIGKKRSDSKKFLAGMWHIPGGGIEQGEPYHDALRREVREETGLEVSVGKFIGISSSPTHHQLYWYECHTNTYTPKCGSDLEDLKLVEKNKVLRECDPKIVALWPKDIKDYFNH